MDVDASEYRPSTKALQDDIIAKLTTMDQDTGAMSGYLATLAGMAEGEMRTLIAGFEDESDWTVLNDETTTKADTTTHITGEGAVSFAKVTGDTVIAGLKRAITAIDLSDYVGDSRIGLNIYLSSIDDVVSVEVRLGTDVDNTQVWKVLVKDLVAGWNLLSFPVGDVETDVGAGWNDAVVTYAVVGVNFSAVTDTLAGIIVDNLSMRTAGPETVRAKVALANATKNATDRVMMVQQLDERGIVAQNTQRQVIDDFEDHTAWTAFNAYTTNKADTTTHITGTNAVTFDKGAGATTVAGIYRYPITSLDLSAYAGDGALHLNIYLSAIGSISSVEIRLGTDASNANVWRVPSDELAVGWNHISVLLGDVQTDIGAGWDDSAILYAAVVVNFYEVGNALSGIIVDTLAVHITEGVTIERNRDKAATRPAELVLAPCDTADDPEWQEVGDAQNLSTSTDHVTGSASIEWDKESTTEKHTTSGVMRKFAQECPFDISAYGPDDCVAVTFRVPDASGVSSYRLQIGTDYSNYNRWNWDEDMAPDNEWVTLYARIRDIASVTGDGWDQYSIGYIAFIVIVADEDTTLTNVLLDRIAIVSAEAMEAATRVPSPVRSEELTEVATTDAEWTSITLTVGATGAYFSLEGDSAYVVCKTPTPADADTGAIFFPNITYFMKTKGRTKIWFRKTSTTNVTIHVTDEQ